MAATTVYSVTIKNCISSLQSHGKALEKECCLPVVFCDSGDTPANLLCELNGHLVPRTSCLYGKWVEMMYVLANLQCYYYYYYYYAAFNAPCVGHNDAKTPGLALHVRHIGRKHCFGVVLRLCIRVWMHTCEPARRLQWACRRQLPLPVFCVNFSVVYHSI